MIKFASLGETMADVGGPLAYYWRTITNADYGTSFVNYWHILFFSAAIGCFFSRRPGEERQTGYSKVEDHEPRLCRPSMNQSQTRLMFEPDPVERSTTQSITPVTNGQYWVIINDINDCESDTAFFTVNWISTSAAGIILTE